MPTYDYICSNQSCNHKRTEIFGIMEYDTMTLKDKPCTNPDGRRKACSGLYEHTFAKPPAFALLGEGWTPKFHHSANQE